MTPTPLIKAFPSICAFIDAERPLIAQAIVDLQVTHIENNKITCTTEHEHSYQILTTPVQKAYLNKVATDHFNCPATIEIHHVSPPSPDSTKPEAERRTSNMLNFMQKQLLYTWAIDPLNRTLMEQHSDNDAATAATEKLGFQITSNNIAGMRRQCGIEKIKPKPEPADIDLVALFERVQRYGLHLDALEQSLTDIEARLKSLEASND